MSPKHSAVRSNLFHRGTSLGAGKLFWRAVVVLAVAFLLSNAIGQSSYTWHNARIVAGGFITGIVYHPNVQNLVYARTDIGGLYRSSDGGANWVPLLDWVNWDNWGY